MKILLIAAAVVPVLFVGAGFGVGKMMSPGKAHPETTTSHQSKAGEDEAKALIEAAEARAKAHAPEDSHADTSHDAPAPVEKPHAEKPHAKPEPSAHGEGHAAAEKPKKSGNEVVKLGQVTIPVYKPMSVTYVVADLGVAMSSADRAAHYRIAENATRLRDNIMQTFREATENPKMRRAAIDSDWLSRELTQNLKEEFHDAEEVLFLSLFKKDVPRS
ncbi:MAG: hypothetical protein KDK24_13880 [Pseudooceanicola sp.]|nr:hypothetical protein [Pseudooceanicola sp.]